MVFFYPLRVDKWLHIRVRIGKTRKESRWDDAGREDGIAASCPGVVKSQTRLRDFTFTFHFHALEKEMAAHSSILAWRIPGTEAWWAAVYGVTQSWTRLT